MHFVTDDFLASLQPGSSSLGGEGGNEAAITEIWVDEANPRFDIEAVSDLLIGGPDPVSLEGSSAGGAEETLSAFVERYRRLRQAFKPERPADLIVSCGDLIAGRRDSSESELRRVESAYADLCLPAFRRLQEADRDGNRADESGRPSPELLSVPGNEDSYRGGGTVHGAWTATPPAAKGDTFPYYSHFAQHLAAKPVPKNPESHPVASVFRIVPRSSAAAGCLDNAPLAYVAVVGFDSNSVQYQHDLVSNYGQVDEEQLHWSRRLISTLRSGAARSAPLYVIYLMHHNLLPVEDRVVLPPRGADDERAVKFQKLIAGTSGGICEPLSRLCVTNQFLADNMLSTTSNSSGLLSHWQQLRTSLVLHGYMHQRAATTLVTRPLAAGQPATELTVLALPSFAAGRPASGMARISLDLWKGEAEIAFHYDSSPDGGPPATPIQIIRPLISASRVSSSERRLYTKISALVSNALETAAPENRSEIQRFADHVAAAWEKDGYAPISFPDGSLPRLGDPTRQNRYYLLLILRETEGRNYEILLNRHNPLRPSQVAEWDTLLMPAFSSVRNLMERLHLDVVRQVVTQAEDVERASSAKAFDAAVDQIQGGGGNVQDDIWLDKIRELVSTRRTKISPTSGEITEYEYRLVVLTPFVRDPKTVDPGQATDKWKQEQLRAELTVVEWLAELPSMRLPGAPLSGRQTIPMEAIMSGGAGLRWEPASDPVEPDDIGEDGSRRRAVMPPGAVWFPLPETDEPEAPWTLAPSIVARNADVMRWVDEQLEARRSLDGLFPPHVVMGKMKETTGYSLAEGPFPFVPPPDCGSSETHLSTSTVEAMNRVQYTDDYDLRRQRPYEGMDIRRLALARRTIRVRSGREREAILVFDATAVQKAGIAGLPSFKTCPADAGHGLLGLLRPAQRYVLKSGLQRAEWVNEFLTDKCASDPWGFLRATFGGAGEPLALTPAVIEQVDRDDWDSDDDSRLEFVVCDGNHRLVRKVWLDGEVAAAIGVLGQPREPYYARPFSPYEWDVTADNVLAVTPDPRFRYAPRNVDPDLLDIPEEARQELRAKPRELLFRRYYRDLNYGFGPMGGQGGRYA